MSKTIGILCTGYGARFITKGDFMNTEQLLNMVEVAINNRPASPAKRWWLCFIDGEFRCVPVEAPAGKDTVLETFTLDQLEKGLSTKQWGRLLTKLAKIKTEETT